MNQKGDLFMLGLDLLFLVMLVLVFWKLGNAFMPELDSEAVGTRQVALLDTYALSEHILLFIDTLSPFAAYEAVGLFAKQGFMPEESPCGVYAGYRSWTSPDGTCFLSQDERLRAFSTPFLSRLFAHWEGLPGVGYDIATTEEGRPGRLIVRGMAQQEIVLPILAAKDKAQSTVRMLAAGMSATPTTVDTLSLQTVWPTSEYRLSSCFGDRHGDHHDGIDIPGNDHPVYAFAAGEVLRTCEGYCGGLGNYIRIKHPNGWVSGYHHLSRILSKTKEGTQVTAGELIGWTGNTGRSTGPHLDFKIFTNGEKKDLGSNPLCFFPETVLKRVSYKSNSNCGKYGIPVSRNSPALQQECESAPVTATSLDGCTFSTEQPDSTKMKRALNRVEALGILPVLQDASSAERLDYRLALGIITQESVGDHTILNDHGAVGLGQFTPIGAREHPRIFRTIHKDCVCPSGACHASAVPACTGDDRLDPEKTARAIPAHLSKMAGYVAKTHPYTRTDIRFGIAAYNTGQGNVFKAIRKTGKREPAYEEVEPYLPAETQAYVRNVLGYYAELGGSEGTVFSGKRCGGTMVKNLGTYTFRPNFKAAIPDVLGVLPRLTAWARETYEQCDGRTDNRICLRQREKVTVPGIEFVGCALMEGENYLVTGYEQFLQDCKDNQQDDCYCEYHPHPARDMMEARLYGNTTQVFVDTIPVNDLPQEDPKTPYRTTENTEGPVSLRSEGGEKQLVVWKPPETLEGNENPFGTEERVFPVKGFRYSKEHSAWLTTEEGSACGVYKTRHHICAKLTTPIYSLSSGKTAKPLIRFAMYLKDTHPPEPVSDTTAISATGALFNLGGVLDLLGAGGLLEKLSEALGRVTGKPVLLHFTPSSSNDVSYYTVVCGRTTKILGRTVNAEGFDSYNDERITRVIGCSPEAGQVTITPYDISGNRGEQVSVKIGIPLPLP